MSPARGLAVLRIFGEKREEISLVVTDVELPEMSGWETFRKMQQQHPAVRALLVSGYLDPPMRARMLDGGAKGFIRKPYTLDEMLRTMRQVLDDGEPDPTAFRAISEGFPVAAMAVLEVPVPWSDLAAGTAHLIDFHVGQA